MEQKLPLKNILFATSIPPNFRDNHVKCLKALLSKNCIIYSFNQAQEIPDLKQNLSRNSLEIKIIECNF